MKIKDWCDKWSKCLNASKCKIKHFGNPGREYFIENVIELVVLGVTELEKGSGCNISQEW